ncbi:MAG TPA: hypothetical protein VEQ66_03395 [Propionibacteriaceae bacterium]|nr:hypothetical protein [Propionibacteriaceae bacterium]
MTTPLALLAGALLAGGFVALIVALLPVTPRLEDALSRITDDPRSGQSSWDEVRDLGPTTSRSEKLGAYAYRHSLLRLTDRQRQNLRLQDKSIAEFYSDKVVMALVGAFLPAALASTWSLMMGSGPPSPTLPAFGAVLGAVVGYLVPNVLLHTATSTVRAGAVEALLVYFDLVTLERLANASATQALHNAAALSEVSIFAQIRVSLQRAQLEQQSPYSELRRLAEELQLPELTDIADVMQLDETGASLSGALRARVRELRDAHLTSEQMAASAAAEGMTLYMTLPTLIFGLIFMVPPLMKIVLG